MGAPDATSWSELARALGPDRFFEDVCRMYADNFGRLKLEQIQARISKSEKIGSLIARSIALIRPPSSKDFLVTVNTIPYFILSKNWTVIIAALCAIRRWDQQVNGTFYYHRMEVEKLMAGVLNEMNAQSVPR